MNDFETTVVTKRGKEIKVSVEFDLLLFVASIVNFGWLKMYFDGQGVQGTINLILSLTYIGALIHGIILAIYRREYFKSYYKEETRAKTIEDAQLIYQKVGIKLDIF